MEYKHTVAIAAVPDLAQWIIEKLEEAGGYDVVHVTDDGRSAERAAHWLKPEILILGMELRTLDGVQLLRRIKKQHQPPKCLVLNEYVALSERLTLIGADCCLVTPCTGSALLRGLESLLLAIV